MNASMSKFGIFQVRKLEDVCRKQEKVIEKMEKQLEASSYAHTHQTSNRGESVHSSF